MIPANSLVEKLINPKTIMRSLADILRELDPEFEVEEQSYKDACVALLSQLDHSMTPNAHSYLCALEESFASDIVFVIGQGFKLNLDIFQNPVNFLAFRLDYEDLHRERMMPMMPQASRANEIVNSFLDHLRESYSDKLDLLDNIGHYYSYLQTVGYKVAHYYGFLLAQNLLPHLISGYHADSTYVSTYGLMLNKDIGLNVSAPQ